MAKAWEELGPQLWAFFHNSVQINMIRVVCHKINTFRFSLASTVFVLILWYLLCSTHVEPITVQSVSRLLTSQ